MRTTRRRRKRPTNLILMAALVGCALVGAAVGQTAPAEPAAGTAEPSRGAKLYRLYCAACHGTEGRGDGPVAETLETTPPDLTRIATRRGGRFSSLELERIIDGRTEIGSHGVSEMPIWGLSFQQQGRLEDQEEEIWLQIRQLVKHLRSIQTGPVIEDG